MIEKQATRSLFGVPSMGMRDLSGWPAIGMTVMATATLGHMSSALAGPCATSPGGQMEPGTHWYYHTDPVDHRQCWHVKRSPTTSETPRNTGRTLSAPTSSGPNRSAARSKSVEPHHTVYQPASSVTADQNKSAADIPLDPARREALFREFLKWQQRQLVESVFRDFLQPQEQDTQAR
jgi:hypothetical protein